MIQEQKNIKELTTESVYDFKNDVIKIHNQKISQKKNLEFCHQIVQVKFTFFPLI